MQVSSGRASLLPPWISERIMFKLVSIFHVHLCFILISVYLHLISRPRPLTLAEKPTCQTSTAMLAKLSPTDCTQELHSDIEVIVYALRPDDF